MGLTRIWRRGIQWDEMLASRKGQLKLLTLACMLWVLGAPPQTPLRSE